MTERSMAEELEEWFATNGGVIHATISRNHADGLHLRYSYNHTKHAPEDPVVSCPHALSLSILDLDCAGDRWPEEFVLHHKDAPEVLTRFFLIDQYLEGRDSFWWPYLSMLPQPTEPHPFHTPLWYGEEDCAWIAGTNLEAARTGRIVAWQREFDEGLELLKGSSRVGSSLTCLYSWYVR